MNLRSKILSCNHSLHSFHSFIICDVSASTRNICCIHVAYREWINLPRFENFNFLISSQSVSFINLLNWKHNIYETRFSKNIFVLCGLWIWNIGMSLTPYQRKDKKGKPRISLMAPMKSEQNRAWTFGVIKMEWTKMSSRL